MQIVGFLMGMNCVPLVAYLFLLCYERDRDFMMSPSEKKSNLKLLKVSARRLDIYSILTMTISMV